MPTFRNPILAGFHPDPSICRVRDDFFLVTSSFEYFPGVPIFHSRDLVHWQPIGHVLTRQSQLDLSDVPSSGGIYAPTLRYSGGLFYVITTHVFGGGNFYVTARSPEGPWSEPVWVDKEGIDPSLLFEGDAVYYTRNGKGKDRDHPIIYQTTIDPKTGTVERPLSPIWTGTGGIWPEAPHLYKFGKTYYLFTAEGGTGYDHSVVVARSSSPSGPFEPCPHNPILTHRHRRGHPIQATGHADLVELDDGSHWAVFLGVRPQGGRHHHLGRETFMAPVTWTKDGWPWIGADRRVEMLMRAPPLSPHSFLPPAARDDFDLPKLAPAWNFLRNPLSRDWSLTRRRGFLRLVGSSVTLDDIGAPAFVGRRQQHFRVRCRAMLEFSPGMPNEEAGLTVRANENFRFDMAVRLGPAGRQALLRSRTRGRSRIVGCETIANGPVRLEVRATDDRYVFTAKVGRQSVRLGDLPARSLSAERVGQYGQTYFTGVYIGMYATGNGQTSGTNADFDWFEYAPGPPDFQPP